ncbi:alpha/beta fold hydrolase [Chloroflexota bacterium]
MQINANKIMVNYEAQGSGPWFTMIHGASNSLDVWSQQIEAFSLYFSTLTYDIRGHGKSGFGTKPVTADILVDDLRSLFEALGISSSIVLGHSMGAELAIRFYLKYPHMVDKLILCNSIMGVLLSEQELPRSRIDRCNNIMGGLLSEQELPQSGINREQGQKDSPDSNLDRDSKIARYFSPGLAQSKPEVIERFKEMLISSRNQRSQQGRLHPGGMVGELIHAPSGELRQITCPTLIISGLNDTIVRPSAVEPIKKCFSNMQVKTIPAGHHSFIELPKQFNQTVLDFALSKDI